MLAGGDVWASAETGSGKTAAFVLPLLERLSRESRRTPRPVRVLVLAPTRELAAQIEGAFALYGQCLAERLKTCVVVGGVSENPQMMALRGGADVVVATPGRLLDLVAKNALTLSHVQSLVLDEADRLLSLGFGDELGITSTCTVVGAACPTFSRARTSGEDRPREAKGMARRSTTGSERANCATVPRERKRVTSDLGLGRIGEGSAHGA